MKDAILYKPLNLMLADKWREMYNPLEWLTLRRIVGWLHLQQYGNVADITWLYEFVERRNPTLMACISRRTSAMEKLDWDVKTVPEDELPDGATKAMAEKQKEKLLTQYQAIDNLRDAINWLSLADFRGFSHLEKHYADNLVTHLEPVPQWNWARSGRTGPWFYNQRALSVYATPESTPTGLTAIEEENFLIREVDYPIDEIAVFAFWRTAQAQKDWDGFVATFGIPPLFIEMPENMPVDKQAEYQMIAERVIGDARGTLPNGAKVVTVDAGARGKNPFLEYMDYQAAQVVLAATGGKLTMLAESGSGNLAGGAHSDTFDEIAEADSVKISEIFQRQFDRIILDEYFPDQPVLARFRLSAKELTDTSAVVKDITGLANAGYAIPLDKIEEKTGYPVELRDPVSKTADRAAQGDTSIGKPLNQENLSAIQNRRRRIEALLNRAQEDPLLGLLDQVKNGIDAGAEEAWAPILNRVNAVLESPDDAGYNDAIHRLIADIPNLLEPVKAGDADVKAWQQGLGTLLVTSLTEKKATKRQEKAVA